MQFSTECVAWNILTSSANIRYLKCLISLQNSVIGIQKIEGPKEIPVGPPKILKKKNFLKCLQKFSNCICVCETNLCYRQKANFCDFLIGAILLCFLNLVVFYFRLKHNDIVSK